MRPSLVSHDTDFGQRMWRIQQVRVEVWPWSDEYVSKEYEALIGPPEGIINQLLHDISMMLAPFSPSDELAEIRMYQLLKRAPRMFDMGSLYMSPGEIKKFLERSVFHMANHSSVYKLLDTCLMPFSGEPVVEKRKLSISQGCR